MIRLEFLSERYEEVEGFCLCDRCSRENNNVLTYGCDCDDAKRSECRSLKSLVKAINHYVSNPTNWDENGDTDMEKMYQHIKQSHGITRDMFWRVKGQADIAEVLDDACTWYSHTVDSYSIDFRRNIRRVTTLPFSFDVFCTDVMIDYFMVTVRMPFNITVAVYENIVLTKLSFLILQFLLSHAMFG